MNELNRQIVGEAITILETSWAQGYYAYRKDKSMVNPYSLDACSFCMVGAVSNVLHKYQIPHALEREDHPVFKAMTNKVSLLGFNSSAVFNDADGRTLEEVLEVMHQVADSFGE